MISSYFLHYRNKLIFHFNPMDKKKEKKLNFRPYMKWIDAVFKLFRYFKKKCFILYLIVSVEKKSGRVGYDKSIMRSD